MSSADVRSSALSFLIGSPLALYTAAQQIADWESTLGLGDTLDIRVVQLSTAAGRGTATTQTLIF